MQSQGYQSLQCCGDLGHANWYFSLWMADSFCISFWNSCNSCAPGLVLELQPHKLPMELCGTQWESFICCFWWKVVTWTSVSGGWHVNAAAVRQCPHTVSGDSSGEDEEKPGLNPMCHRTLSEINCLEWSLWSDWGELDERDSSEKSVVRQWCPNTDPCTEMKKYQLAWPGCLGLEVVCCTSCAELIWLWNIISTP